MLRDADIARTVRHLAEGGYMTIVWADERLVVTARLGDLAPEIAVASGLCDTALPLMGLEEQIGSLRHRPGTVLEMPDIAVVGNTANGSPPRLGYRLSWDRAQRRYVCTIQRSLTANELAIELQRQARRRMLAEAELLEQATAIAAANEALTTANRDLGDFARIVSHDLKSPLRALRYFAEDLERALVQPSPGNDPGTYLNQLKQQSRRISSMLTGLLTYARLEDKSEAMTTVDLRVLIDSVVASLPRPEGFTIDIEGEWPSVKTLETPLDLILRNLVDNAIRHHPCDNGRVRVICARGSEVLEIVVEDDGGGIPLKDHEAVFRPYTRSGIGVEGREPAGTGMGLTLVKRAVDTTGAQLELISDPDTMKGSRFVLRWPL
jgi:signal transduction histidine kinase